MRNSYLRTSRWIDEGFEPHRVIQAMNGVERTPEASIPVQALSEKGKSFTIVSRRLSAQIGAIDCHGALDAYTEARLKDIVDEHIEVGRSTVVFNLQGIRGLDLFGIRALERLGEQLLAKGGKIVVVCASPKFSEQLRVLGLSKHFEIYNSEEEALRTIRSVTPEVLLDTQTER